MAVSDKFFRGQNVTFKFYQNGKNVYIAAKNWNVNQNGTEINDGVNGEQRDRLDFITNSFSASVDMYQSDQEFMQALMDAQSANDAQGLPLKQTAAIQIRHRDGTKATYLLKECCVGPWGTTMSGRTEAVMMNIKLRFAEYSPVQSF